MVRGSASPLIGYLRTMLAPSGVRELSDSELLYRFVRLS